MNIHDRIKARREELNMSVRQLAELVGVSYQSVQGWELQPGERNSAAPSRNRLKIVAEQLKTSVEWLTSGIDVNVPIRGKYVFIARLEPTSEGGDVKYHVEVDEINDEDNSFAYRRDYLEQIGVTPASCGVFLPTDDSMALGEQLLVDLSQRAVVDGKVYLLATPLGATVRRLYVQLDGTVRVRADRPDVPEQIMPLAAVKVLGRVVAFQGSI